MSKYKIGRPGEVEVGDTVAHKVPPCSGYNDRNGLNTAHNGDIWTSRVKEIKDGIALMAYGGSYPVAELVRFEETV